MPSMTRMNEVVGAERRGEGLGRRSGVTRKTG
jgi:hypothetical protein